MASKPHGLIIALGIIAIGLIVEKAQSSSSLIEARPGFMGKGYRVDIENWGIPDKATAGDVVRFEEEELGNRLGVPAALVEELDKYHHSDVIWVTKKREDAKHYLSEGMTEADISEIDVGAGARIIADDGEDGGYLVLRGGAQPRS